MYIEEEIEIESMNDASIIGRLDIGRGSGVSKRNSILLSDLQSASESFCMT